MSERNMVPGTPWQVRGVGSVRLKRFTIRMSGLHMTGTPCWRIMAWPHPSHSIVERPDGAVIAIEKRRYTEEKARALFLRLMDVIDAEDLSGLRKACHHSERDDEFFYIAFGIMGEREAMAMRRHNQAELALWRRFRAGEISKDELQKARLLLDAGMAAGRPTARA